MEREQVQTLYATMKQIHHALGGTLTSLNMVGDEFDALSVEVKAKFEAYWCATYWEILEDLKAIQPICGQASQTEP
ncbi:MAG: hypothetical protein NT075_25005 [Chloroflexi bacterium]|nr:hypothetical protein [Chloroflexota bacterium]